MHIRSAAAHAYWSNHPFVEAACLELTITRSPLIRPGDAPVPKLDLNAPPDSSNQRAVDCGNLTQTPQVRSTHSACNSPSTTPRRLHLPAFSSLRKTLGIDKRSHSKSAPNTPAPRSEIAVSADEMPMPSECALLSPSHPTPVHASRAVFVVVSGTVHSQILLLKHSHLFRRLFAFDHQKEPLGMLMSMSKVWEM